MLNLRFTDARAGEGNRRGITVQDPGTVMFSFT